MALPEPGLFAVCGATTYPVVGTDADALMLRVTDGAPVPDHVAAGEDRRGRPWVKVPRSAVTRYFDVRVTVAWQGEQLELGRTEGERAEVHSDDPARADRLGLEGDQYNGFRGTAPVDELTVVDVREREIHV